MDTCVKDYSYYDYCIMNLGDCYTILYGHICKHLIDDFGEKGERAVRRGTRHYGWDRGFITRNKCLNVHAKINMKNLFSLFGDLPGDPRFRREKQRLNPEERVSHTLVCPMSDIWLASGQQREGRIYCEEFHPACYSHYAFDLSQVNLAMTLTQPGDGYCAFNVKLIKHNVPKDLRPVCFPECDPDYEEPVIERKIPDAKTGFNALSIKVYYHVLDCAVKDLGEAGADSVNAGLKEFASQAAALLMETARKQGVPADKKYVHDNFPLSLDGKDELWAQKISLTEDPGIDKTEQIFPDDSYSGHKARERVQKYVIDNLMAAMGL